MGLVFVCAVGLAALRSATWIWAAVMTTLLWGTLSFAVLGIIYGRDNVRRFWTGFTVFGLSFAGFNIADGNYSSAASLLDFVYAKLSHGGAPAIRLDRVAVWVRDGKPIWIEGEQATDDNQIGELLQKAATKKPTAPIWFYSDVGIDAAELLKIRQHMLGIIKAQAIGLIMIGTQPTSLEPEIDDFRRVGYAVMTLLAAFLGGLLASLFFRTKEQTHSK